MQTAINQFRANLQQIRDLHTLYQQLVSQGLTNLSDLLRSEHVYAVSALDKLMHELIRIGMLQIFDGSRLTTAKFQNFTISMETFVAMQQINTQINLQQTSTIDLFDREIILRHKLLSFQEPEKIADGLSFIWNEQYKWQKIAETLSLSLQQPITERDTKIKLKNIVARRNQIVHEADIDVVSGNKQTIYETDTEDLVAFINFLGESIYVLVR